MSEQLANVIKYYDSTNFEYEHFWSRQSLAMHFGFYDNTVNTHQESLQKMNQVLSELARISESDHVLDAGCGYGGSAIWLAENIGCTVVGSNIVPYQIKKAKRFAKKSHAADKLQFIQASYLDTGMQDTSFDIIWGLESIVHCNDKGYFLKEAFRLLRPGGRILISEYLLEPNVAVTQTEKKDVANWLKAWAMPNLLTEEEYKKYLKSAGFEKIEVFDLSEKVERSLLVCRTYAHRALQFVGILQKISLINNISTDNTVANYKLHDLFKRGIWRYKVIVAVKS